ncbi:hypothetical protein [Ferroacidibacillus organovorans]|uniref:Uncharacterized protein n=1 Tax=Ferroacidibacillus organovorans TaxID=1765683 RepID=A0A101XQ62_9BACL|nr:hypothetical protein [Ferroacidibacillus organovorans]KUO95528.1 hypothetical protein ATW55_06445 [Ferroacidibacillus organovorans]
MDELWQFLAVMAALSTGSQAITQQMKKRIVFLHLQAKAKPNDSKWDELYEDALRKLNVQLLSGVNGTALAALAQVHPLQILKLTPSWTTWGPPWLGNTFDYLSAGVLVAYGGPWFHDLLGILREYKVQLRNLPVAKQGK